MADIRMYNGRPAIHVDGKFYPPMMATIRTNNIDHMVIDREYYRRLGAAGIRIFFVICDTVWLKPNALELFREEAEIILEEVPDALLVPRIGLHPTNEWIKAHPEECLTYSDGSKPGVHLFSESYITDLPMHYSLCSDLWREDAGKALAETWQMLMQLPYADHIIGCFLAAGGTSEWYYMHPVVKNGLTLDHSEAFRRHFSRFLRAKYGTDAQLQKQWKNPDATLANPPIPDAEKHYFAGMVDHNCAVPPYSVLSNMDVPTPEGNGTSVGAIANVDKNQDVHDFYLAWHEGTADSVLHFAKIIKNLTPDKLVGAFYGAHGCTNFLTAGTSGGTVKILDSDCVDFLAAPGVYENRMAGGFEGQREFHDSFAVRGKIYIVEQDTRTHMENAYFRNKYGIYDLTDSINIMKREFGRNIAEDTQAWWFDQLLGGRRYKHNELYSLIARQQEISAESYTLNREKTSEIAFIFDAESLQLVSQQTSRDLIEMLHNHEIARIGAPVDQYYHNDMANPAMPDYKMYVFVNTIELTDEERCVIKEKLRKNNAAAVWIYASGLVNPDRDKKLDAANITDLTEIPMETDTEKRDGKYRLCDENRHPITALMQPRFVYGWLDRRRNVVVGSDSAWESYMFPAFYPTEGEVAAEFVNTGKPAITVAEANGFTSVFHGSKTIRFDVLRSIAAWAGCHIWCYSDDVTYIGRNYITIHASSNGKKTLHFPRPVKLTEVYENQLYAENAAEVSFDMYLGETKMFRME
ncbi:MAG: hypothetical protein E7662_04325 [Ruminococcaceae bacterium]|nr:hypothetical protein [Oscillospiraceae bacterium]